MRNNIWGFTLVITALVDFLLDDFIYAVSVKSLNFENLKFPRVVVLATVITNGLISVPLELSQYARNL